MKRLVQYNIDCYIGIQLICCIRWKGNFRLGDDKAKKSFFLSHFTPHEHNLLLESFIKMDREIESGDIFELINEYCSLIPKEYKADALRNCREIIHSYSPLHPMDQKIISAIEAKLDSTVDAAFEVVG